MKLLVEAYNASGELIEEAGHGQGVFNNKVYKLTSWYRDLPWFYSHIVSYYLIKKFSNNRVLERVEHHL